jgi:hypothetical protein
VRPRLILLLALGASLATPAFAQPTAPVPPGRGSPGVNPTTGARPGTGTGMSPPMSGQAANITPQDTNAEIAAPLPEPPVGDNAAIHDYLLAARNALAEGRNGEAQEALEMAETRALDRSVPLFQTSTPSSDPMVERITQVLHTLGNGDRLEAMRLLEQAIAAGGS